MLAGVRQAEESQEKGEDTVMNSEITAKSMHGFLERTLAQCEITLEDCETFLYCL